MSSTNVHFRFVGDGKRISSVDVVVPKTSLNAASNSLLSRLADKVWKGPDKTEGETNTNPILTKPLEAECKDAWSPMLSNMIAEAYLWHEQRQMQSHQEGDDSTEAKLKLPQGVELEDALAVLDYYGLPIENPESSIDVKDTDDITQIRSALFLQDNCYIAEAKEFILQHLKQSPARVTYFLFAEHGRDIEEINNLNECEDSVRKFIRVGSTFSVNGICACDIHCEWVNTERHREKLVSDLRDVGLKAALTTGMTVFFPSHHLYTHELLPPGPPKDGYTWILNPPNYNDGYPCDRRCHRQHRDIQPTLEEMCVVRVEVPDAIKERRSAIKKRRTG